jgi:hypothetical protein
MSIQLLFWNHEANKNTENYNFCTPSISIFYSVYPLSLRCNFQSLSDFASRPGRRCYPRIQLSLTSAAMPSAHLPISFGDRISSRGLQRYPPLSVECCTCCQAFDLAPDFPGDSALGLDRERSLRLLSNALSTAKPAT